jgi:regulatory protein
MLSSQVTSDSLETPLKNKSQQPSLLARAIRFLSNREHSREELIRKLKPYAESIEEIEEVLKKLQAKDLQSDARFAENLVRRRAERYGQLRIIQELKQNKIDSVTSQELIEQLRTTEFDRAKELWERKFGVVASEPKELARQARYLASKGFSSEVVSKIVRGKTLV